MTLVAPRPAVVVPEQGNLVRVRDRYWVVKSVVRSETPPDSGDPVVHHAVELVPIDAEGSPDSLTVFWEVEPGTEVRPQTELPDPADGLDDAETFGAFLDAVRWGAIASADPSAFQAPFRAGIEIEDYQLLPLVMALEMPRVTMLIADDVGLGKTIEAGLIAEELVLRGQARKILVVCPPSLCGKWQREMREKFGLGFEIVDTAYVRRLRRERGVGVNPFRSHPRLIVSMDWVKFEQQMRRIEEILPPDPNTYPRAFDLLIVDEAHQIAPAAVGRYAKDSLRTQALRRLAPHFEHRLFLTATPHNGYRESFESLLETLDPNRFAKGVEPSDRERDAVMVRRLKSHLRTLLPDGDARFPHRRLHSIEVDFAAPERTMFRLLDEYAAARRATAESPAESAAARCIILLLKKRLLSSPMGFKRTLDKHIATLNRAAGNSASTRAASADRIEAAQQAALDADVDSDDSLDDVEQKALALAATALPETGVADEVLLARLRARAIPFEAGPREILDKLRAVAGEHHRRPDAKTTRLLDWIGDTCFPGGEWNDERVIVFTEYRDTLQYLYEMLTAPGAGRPDMRGRVEVFHGDVDADERERIIREFNYDPVTTTARVLIATDVAAEGIDLHRACYRLVHADIPFNPNRMEQRNGRVDRHGQRSAYVDLFHFAGAADGGPGDDPAGYDHSFLLRVAQKIDEIRDDLGAVSPVLAEHIEARMLRERDGGLDIDAEVAARRDRARIGLRRLEQDLVEGLADVRRKYQTSLEELELSPASIERAVGAGLRISNQPALQPITVDRPTGPVEAFDVPDMSGTWGELLGGLYDEVIERRRPVTFDSDVAAGHDDVAYGHVAHPFVARCLRALRAQVWGAGVERHVNRVAVRCADVEEPVAVGYARVVVNGADGSVLDEVIEPAAIRVGGRQGRLNVGETRAAMRAAHAEAPPDHVRDRYVDQWPRVRPALTVALKARAQEVQAQRERRMDDKRDRETRRVRGTLDDLRISINRRLEELTAEAEAEQLRLFLDDDERCRFGIDIDALRDRLGRIDDDVATEVEALQRRYDVRDVHWFPVAVEILVPAGEE